MSYTRTHTHTHTRTRTRARSQSANKLALLQYTANWCHPCKVVTPAINRLSRMEKDVVFMRVDIDRVPMVAQVRARARAGECVRLRGRVCVHVCVCVCVCACVACHG